MRVILDPKAGTCGGVRRAIQLAEKELAKKNNRTVFVLGDIIHNEREVERLDNAGLRTIHKDDLDELQELRRRANRAKVLVRAHGEPPETFEQLKRIGVKVVDGTCPVVTRSQKLASEFQQGGYQVVIIGKHGHPEMIGIVGHTENEAIVVQCDADIKKLKQNVPTMVMVQTTILPAWFDKMVKKIKAHVGKIEVRDTLCRFVVRMEKVLPNFASEADVILVVGGHKSSNTKMLHSICKGINSHSYHVVSTDEVEVSWMEGAETIGITGSASTPLWLLEEFVETLKKWIEEGRFANEQIHA